jgi:hypothetical protein
MKREAERRAELERKGHGTYEEATEGDFLEARAGGAGGSSPGARCSRRGARASPPLQKLGRWARAARPARPARRCCPPRRAPRPPLPAPQITTKTENVVCHFFHKDFERCKIVDKHLALLAKKYLETRFIKLSAPVRCTAGAGRQREAGRSGGRAPQTALRSATRRTGASGPAARAYARASQSRRSAVSISPLFSLSHVVPAGFALLHREAGH